MDSKNNRPSMENQRQEILAVFREEASEMVALLSEQFELLRAEQSGGLTEVLTSAMLLTHNLKGMSGTVGLSNIVALSHVMEDAFGHFRKTNQRPDESYVELLLKALTAIEHIVEGRPSPYQLQELLSALAKPLEDPADPSNGAEGSTETSSPRSEEQLPEPGAATTTQKRDGEPSMTSVRVEVRQLDRLMNQAGELLVTKARLFNQSETIEQLHEDFKEVLRSLPADTAKQLEGFRDGLNALEREAQRRLFEFGHLTDEIGETTRKLRMLPLNNYIPVWRRAVRESAQKLGKQVELKVEVGDIELDKAIFDRLRDPFLHLLRNAVDHGIEPPEERAALGKKPTGKIQVRASVRGANVQIDIADDGRGLSIEHIGRLALEKNIVTTAQLDAMTEDEVRSLIFTPDFSTAAEVSSISGRGVGMSIVKKNLAGIGGSVALGQPGDLTGSAFRLTLPMSVLSIRGLLMRTETCTYAVPIENVERVETIDRADCRMRGGTLIHERPGKEPIRLSRLRSLMDCSQSTETEQWIIVIISHNDAQLGLVVDQLLGEDEFVTKRLPWNVKYVRGVNGAVVLGDGSLAIVIDVPYLFEATPSGNSLSAPGVKVADSGQAKKILVVDDSRTSRTMTRTVLRAKGYEITEAVDGAQAWELLQRESFDLIVTDIQMPKLDGLQLTRRIRADQELKHLPIILVTNMSSPDDLARGVQAGADEYIVKERFNKKSFLEAVARHI